MFLSQWSLYWYSLDFVKWSEWKLWVEIDWSKVRPEFYVVNTSKFSLSKIVSRIESGLYCTNYGWIVYRNFIRFTKRNSSKLQRLCNRAVNVLHMQCRYLKQKLNDKFDELRFKTIQNDFEIIEDYSYTP